MLFLNPKFTEDLLKFCLCINICKNHFNTIRSVWGEDYNNQKTIKNCKTDVLFATMLTAVLNEDVHAVVIYVGVKNDLKELLSTVM